MRINLYAHFLICLLTMLGILLCYEVRSQTSDTIPTIHLPLAYEDFSLYDFGLVRMETDKKGSLPLDVIKRRFRPAKEVLPKDEFHLADSVESFWIQFQIANNQSNDTTIALVFPGVSKAVLYKAEEGQLIEIGKTGFFYAVLARNISYRDNRIDLVVKAYSKTKYFIQVILYNGIWLPKMPTLENFIYAEAKSFEYEKGPNRLRLLWSHFFSGIFFMFFVFGFIKYLVVGKDRAYFYFSLMGLFLFLLPFSQSENPPLELPWFESIRGVELQDTLADIVFIIQGLFILEILHLKTKYARITRFIKWYLFIKLLLILTSKVLFFVHTDIYTLDFLNFYVDKIIFFLLLISWVVYMATIRKGFYKFIFFGAVTIFIAYTLMFIFAYFELGYLLPDWFGGDQRERLYHFMDIAYVVDMLFYFTGLAYRDRQVEKDKIVFQEQLIKQLETNKDLQEKFTGELAQQVKEKTAEVVKEKAEVENTLQELKSTQAQLIQSEKMASLGELTAGIAHEIQNPLNFVKNFSEVNNEILAEMNDEIEKENYEEVKSMVKDVLDNEEKILFHGKRADAIVKGMLQHSRSSSGKKESTNINALADEYLRLAYHGLRAKDKSFNATMKTDFDEKIGNINIIPQDIGRVILNLINNAFYAVDEKKKQIGDGYEPTVSVSTKKINEKAEISVKDNANGIPQKVLDKIFQPFFTTKPTGQGTGLGLSLSYDIVKAHGGELKVKTKEGEGTVFCVALPA